MHYKRLCEKCVMNLKIKIEAQASLPDAKIKAEKDLRELSKWLSLSPLLRAPKRKDGKSGSDSSSSSSSSTSSTSEDEKSKTPSECKLCRKSFGMFKKSVSLRLCRFTLSHFRTKFRRFASTASLTCVIRVAINSNHV